MQIIRTNTRQQIKLLVETVKSAQEQKKKADPRRRHPRVACKLPLQIEITDPANPSKPIEAYTHNISNDGLCFLSIRQFTPGQNLSLKIETENKWYVLHAIVVHSTPFEVMNKTGVKFEHDGP